MWLLTLLGNGNGRTMTRDELLKTLQSLHQELADTTNLDDETRRMLQVVTDDIRGRLEQPAAGQDAAAQSADASLSDRVRESMVQFENQYPQLTAILQRLTDGLAKLGI